MCVKVRGPFIYYVRTCRGREVRKLQFLFIFNTLKSLINEQGGYVLFLVLSEYSFIRDFSRKGGSKKPKNVLT